MSAQSAKVKNIGQRVARLRKIEEHEDRAWKRWLDAAQRWFWMLYHEYLRDDVKIRAQSLSFLMIFSLLPLIAGAFFIFTFLAQFGMVQDAIQGMVDNFLSSIPLEHRQILDEYILHFKDAYLQQITKTSGSVGVFALLIMGWIGLQTFNNVDATLNYIWSADRSRPLSEKTRNFIVVVVVAPIVLTGGFSVPLILKRFHVTNYLFTQIPLLGVMLNYVIPWALILGIFLVMYRYVPVRRVWWRSAFWGAVFATISLAITHVLMRVYFAFGTHSAYGKAAVVPLVGFWIYALWIVVILGAEVSFLLQNGRDIFVQTDREPTIREGQGLITMLVELYRAHHHGPGPLSFETLRDKCQLDSGKARLVIQYLLRQRWIAEVITDKFATSTYLLARDIGEVSVESILEDYFEPCVPSASSSIDKLWRKGLSAWTSSFSKIHLADLAK